jgi:SAM-dependent methyltransferase
MGVQERLSLEAVSADTLIATEHVHRYRLAARACAGLRVVDLACGSGYGSAILRKTASAVLGVDNDEATIDIARSTVGAADGVQFEAADAVEFLGRELEHDWDAIVCFEGLEHIREPALAVEALRDLAAKGMKLAVSLPNSRTLGEENRFHVTDFSYDEAMRLFEELGDADVLYQFNAEGSLIRREESGQLEAEEVLSEYGEPDYANHFIALVNFGDAVDTGAPSARMRLDIASVYTRHMLMLERANKELWRENTRLARGLLGKSDAAAGTMLFRRHRELEQAEARAEALEAEVEHLGRRLSVLDTPRHVAVERLREALMKYSGVYAVLRRLWRRLNRL